MGVFARLLRRSKATEEAAPAAEAQADKATAGTEAEETAGADAAAKGADGAAEAAEPVAEAAEVTETEGVDIPKQQSTDKAADNEAGEGART
ncbi:MULTISPECIES: hypothetical protein [Streptomyces]|uniref:Gliding motility protein n=1 Tax=Streptomyces chartreusis NRRL 3882 TaxID=1079985 RepID=A0A2N9B5J0_STRCX|nr:MULTISPECIES: hypothetical protein [Streptomyces]MYS89867.1 hypothetical protein [Streptomyces sp. SID5464]SOR78610.1 hypothetical protein SCNRRL3882_2077 [Streptomyces chartreusis NRRL 3882]